ncbi:hypothetical protein TCE0_018r04655 [Talaromyces pinophilus]|uniref:Uncharacterized protein n=1 Tax=Talaromyces pinophilus TaxID=128442 RepID=A0A510NUP1_TALPI|nr:hypothetical protein TCE0_018r04655 [Talaromyces pinophilus]
MSYTKLANIYYPDRDPRALRKVINAHEKKTRDEEKARASRDNVTPAGISTTTTGTSLKSPERVTAVETRDHENSSSDEGIEDIYFSGERNPNKRVKLTYSTRSQVASGKLQWSQNSATIQSESSESPKSLDQSTLTLSPRLRRGNIVPFSEHAKRNLDLGAAENNNENHGMLHSTPPPPPPSVPPPSTPPPPPEESRKEQAQDQTVVVAAVDHSIRQSETQNQVGEYAPKHGLFSAADIKKEIAQQTAKTHQWIEWLLTVKEEYETIFFDQEKKLKQYESMETDKNSQISRLQTERKQLISENMALSNKLKKISDFSAGRTDDLNSTIAGA